MRPSPTLRLLSLVAIPIVVGIAALARGDLEVTLRNGDRVRGTIFPASEQESFAIELPRGAKLQAVATPKKTPGRQRPPPMSLRLLDHLGRDVGQDSVDNDGPTGRINKFVVADSGRHRVLVSGDRFRIGDYKLSVKWTSKRRFKWRGSDTSEGIQSLDFAADTGAFVIVKARASKGSPALPVVTDLVRVENGQETVVHTFTFPTRPQKSFVGKTAIIRGGDHRLKLRDGGGVGGPVDVTVRLKTSGGRRNVRLTDADIDVPPEDVRVVATMLVDAAGGTSPATAPRVVFPVDALTKLTPLQIGVGDPFDGPLDSGLLPVGPSVFLGPARIEFERQVDVQLPFDPGLFGGDLSSLRVVRRDEAGSLSIVQGALRVDSANARVTAPVRSGGTLGVFRLVPPPSVTSLTPFIGPLTGGFTFTLYGEKFRDDRDAFGALWLQVTIDGEPVEVTVVSITSTQFAFVAPGHLPGKVTFGLLDRETGILRELSPESFEYR